LHHVDLIYGASATVNLCNPKSEGFTKLKRGVFIGVTRNAKFKKL